ncbi:MAG: hypothetical protein KGJ13_09555, partial [Patescibacteria group bacterium]|nr:hypothetical protein [Patescibacteria group bacterium]
MNDVLERIREKYPQYESVSDDDLISKIGEKYPKYLSRPSFKADFDRIKSSKQSAPKTEPFGTLRPTSLLERLRDSEAARRLLGPPAAEREGMIGSTGSPKEILDTAFKFATPPPPVQEAVRKITDPAINLLPDTAAGIVTGAREAALGIPLAAGAVSLGTKIGNALLAVFSGEYLLSIPEQKQAFDAARKRGDNKTAAAIATQAIASGALLAAGGTHALREKNAPIPELPGGKSSRVGPGEMVPADPTLSQVAIPNVSSEIKPQTIGESNASSIQTPTEIHGDVQPQPEPRLREVPVEEGRGGVQPPAQALPEAPAPVVELRPQPGVRPLTETQLAKIHEEILAKGPQLGEAWFVPWADGRARAWFKTKEAADRFYESKLAEKDVDGPPQIGKPETGVKYADEKYPTKPEATKEVAPATDTIPPIQTPPELLSPEQYSKIYEQNLRRSIVSDEALDKKLSSQSPSTPYPKSETPETPKGPGIVAGTPAEAAAKGPGIVGMGGATPEELTPSGQTVTGIKNASIDAQRAQRGLPPVMKPLRESFGQWWDQAMAQIDADPGAQDRLIKELQEKPRPLKPVETAMLLHREADLRNEYARTTREMAIAFDDG